MTTAQERLDEVYLAYSSAYQRRFADLKEAEKQQHVKDILNNVRNLEASYLKAAAGALDATGGAVERAYRDAQQARTRIEDAYTSSVAIAEKIRLVGTGAKIVGELVKKAQA